jgi:hypothetical protein
MFPVTPLAPFMLKLRFQLIERRRLSGQAPMREITSKAVKPVSFHTQPLEPVSDVSPVPCPKELKQHIIGFESGGHSFEAGLN